MTEYTDAQAEYYENLYRFVTITIKEWQDKSYTGNMMINWTNGKVTGFKPSLNYGTGNSTSPEMYILFDNSF